MQISMKLRNIPCEYPTIQTIELQLLGPRNSDPTSPRSTYHFHFSASISALLSRIPHPVFDPCFLLEADARVDRSNQNPTLIRGVLLWYRRLHRRKTRFYHGQPATSSTAAIPGGRQAHGYRHLRPRSRRYGLRMGPRGRELETAREIGRGQVHPAACSAHAGYRGMFFTTHNAGV